MAVAPVLLPHTVLAALGLLVVRPALLVLQQHQPQEERTVVHHKAGYER